jgi:hypothetical protein
VSAHPAELRSLHLAMLDAVLVGRGLGAVADLAASECGGPVALIVPRLEVAAGSAGALGDLGRLRGYALARCRGRVAPVPEGVAAEVPIASGEELVGVVLLLGDDVVADEHCLERLRLVAVAALTEIALARAGEIPDERASATLLDALASGATLSREEIVRRAARAGCDLRHGAVALCCELHVERPHHLAALVRDDWAGALAQHVIPEVGAPRLHALLPVRDGIAGTATAADAAALRLVAHGPVGLSEVCEDPGALARAMEEASLAVDLRASTGGPPWEISAADPEAVRGHYEATLAPVVSYDKQYDTELLPTLERVLGADGNVATVASDLGMPEHRVRFRLEKVRELNGWDAGVLAHRRALALGLRCFRVVAPGLPG